MIQFANLITPITIDSEYNAYVINITAASKSGHMDLIACIKGSFYGFEIKWKSDQPSELQKDKINKCVAAGGKAYFVYSTKHLCYILDNNVNPITYDTKNKYIL